MSMSESRQRPKDRASRAAYGRLGIAGKCLVEDESAFKEDAGIFPYFLRPGAPRIILGGGYALVFPFLGLRDGARTIVGSFLRMAPQYPKGMHADENRPRSRSCPGQRGGVLSRHDEHIHSAESLRQEPVG